MFIVSTVSMFFKVSPTVFQSVLCHAFPPAMYENFGDYILTSTLYCQVVFFFLKTDLTGIFL